MAFFRRDIPTPFDGGPVNSDPVTLIVPGPDYLPARETVALALNEVGLSFLNVQREVVTHGNSDPGGPMKNNRRRACLRLFYAQQPHAVGNYHQSRPRIRQDGDPEVEPAGKHEQNGGSFHQQGEGNVLADDV